MLHRIFLMAVCMFSCIVSAAVVRAQTECVTYKLVPRISYETQPVTFSQFVDQTVMETKPVTTYKPVWTRETRYRKTTVLKPITKTSHREERYLVRRPIVETSYVEQQVQETSYQTVTEMKEQRWLVEKPVVETQYREQQYLVKKPVTQTYMQTENVTTLKPVTIRETQYVPGAAVSDQFVLESGRNRLRWLRPGTYVDPVTGAVQHKRAGLHWVPDQQLAIRSNVVPTLLEQQVDRTAYSPETVQVQRPVQLTQYVDQIETRKVPVQVSKTSREIMVTQTPVTVQKPVTNTSTRRVPVQEVKYREEVLVRRVPVTETTYQRVENVEPYEVEVCKWVAQTQEVQIPRTVRRRVDYSMNQLVPRNDWITVPVDALGNVIGQTSATVADRPTQTVYRYPISDRISAAPVSESTLAGSKVQTTIQTLTDAEYEQWLRRNNLVRETAETSSRSTADPKSIIVPETKEETRVDRPTTDLVQVRRPTLADQDNDQSEQQLNGPADANEQSAPSDSNGPVLADPGTPEIDDEVVDSSLDIDSGDAADIDSREDN